MGFSDKDFYKLRGYSDRQLKKMAGNSIVVDVLINIMKFIFESYPNLEN